MCCHHLERQALREVPEFLSIGRTDELMQIIPPCAFLSLSFNVFNTSMLLFPLFFVFAQDLYHASDVDPYPFQVRINGADAFLDRFQGLIRQVLLSLSREGLRLVLPAGVQFRFLPDQNLFPLCEPFPFFFVQARR